MKVLICVANAGLLVWYDGRNTASVSIDGLMEEQEGCWELGDARLKTAQKART